MATTYTYADYIKLEAERLEKDYVEQKKALEKKIESGEYENKQAIEERLVHLEKMHELYEKGHHSKDEKKSCLTKAGRAIVEKHLKHIEELKEQGLNDEEIKEKLREEAEWNKEYFYAVYMDNKDIIVPHENQKAYGETDMKTYKKIKKMMGKDEDAEDETDEDSVDEDDEEDEEDEYNDFGLDCDDEESE